MISAARTARLCVLLALAGCAVRPVPAPIPAPAPAPKGVIALQGSVAVFDGPILRDSMDKLQAVIGTEPVSRLRIRSGGGEVGAAIRMARWVHANRIDVEVDGPCFSSCANYIFPAGHHKYIVGNGFVAWHGTLEHLLYKHEQGLDPVDEKMLSSLRQMVERERAFYADTGLNSFLGWFGKMAPYEVANMYFMSADDMAYFGLDKLHVRADYLRDAAPVLVKRDPGALRLLKVDRGVTNATDPRWRMAPAPR